MTIINTAYNGLVQSWPEITRLAERHLFRGELLRTAEVQYSEGQL